MIWQNAHIWLACGRFPAASDMRISPFFMKDVHAFAAKGRAVCVMMPGHHHIGYNSTI
jgi:hypothetical protein